MIRPPRSGRISIAQRWALSLTTLIVLTACTRTATGAQATPTAHPSGSASPSTSATPIASPTTTSSHVFVIVLENRSYSQALSTPYIAELANQYGLATNYRGVSHPSLPNYLAMTSGSTWGIVDDGWHPLGPGGLGAQLDAASVSWRAYMEGITGDCYRNVNRYALKHNPFAYYGGQCPAQVVPFSQFASDISGTVPQFVWITPDLCHDGHDCSNAVVSDWLAHVVPTILATDAWKHDGVLFITYDEGEDSANSVLTLVIHERPVLHQSSRPYDHYSLLATIEDTLGLPRLGAAANASAMLDLMASWPLPRPFSSG